MRISHVCWQVGLHKLLGNVPTASWRESNEAAHKNARERHEAATRQSAGYIMLALRDAAEYGSDTKMTEEIAKLPNDKQQGILNTPMPSSGMTLMMQAAAAQSPEVVKLLLNGGASALLQDKQGRSALHWAVAMGCYKSAQLMLSEAALNTTNKDGATPKDLAITLAREPMVELFENYKQSDRSFIHAQPSSPPSPPLLLSATHMPTIIPIHSSHGSHSFCHSFLH